VSFTEATIAQVLKPIFFAL